MFLKHFSYISEEVEPSLCFLLFPYRRLVVELTNNRDIGQLQWAPYSRMFMILRRLILRDRVKIANLLLPSTEASDLHYEKKNLCSRGLFEKI